MILTVRKIELKNWMTHREETVEFPDSGIFLLWGRSGSGKSSLLESIAFALSGASATRAKSLDELKHELYPDENMEVRITLGIGDGREVQIYRGVDTKNKSSAWIVDENGTFIEGNKQVTEKIDELLGGMDGPTLFSTYYSQQGELDALIKMPGGGRRKFVQRMLGVHVLDTVLRELSKKVNNLGERINLIEESLPQESIEELSDYRIKTMNILQQKESLQIEAMATLEALEIKGKQLREILDKSRASWEEFNSLKPQLQTWETTVLQSAIEKIESLKKEMHTVQEAKSRLEKSPDLKMIEDLEKEADALAEKEGALHSLQSKEKELQSAQTNQKQIAEEKKDAEKTPEIEFEDPQVLAIQKAALEQEYINTQTEIKALVKQHKDTPEICPTCNRAFDKDSREHAKQEFENKHAVLLQRKEELQKNGLALKNRLETAQILSEKAKQRQEKIEQINRAYANAEEEIKKHAYQLEDLKTKADGADAWRLREARNKLSKLAVEKASIQADKQKAESENKVVKDLEQAQSDKKKLEEKIVQATQRLKELSVDPEKRISVEKQYETTRNDYALATKTLGETNTELERLKAEKNRIDDLIHRHETLKEQRKEAHDEALKLGKTKESITQFRHNLIGSIRPMLQDLTSSHLADLTEGTMPAVQISEDYDLSIKRNGEFRRIGLCSGGEMARSAFSLRLALTQLVSQRTDTPVGFMVFDEIFGSQDEEHRKAILDALVHLRGIYPQVFLISHEETLKDSPLVSKILSVPESSSANRITIEDR